MEEMRKKLQKDTRLLTSFLVGMVVFLICYIVLSEEKSTFSDGIVDGFCMGLLLGGIAICCVQIIRFRNMLKDDKQIRMYLNKRNDERMKEIRSKSGMPVVLYFSIMILIAAVIAGFYSITIFMTLFAVAFVQLGVGCILKVYYSHKL